MAHIHEFYDFVVSVFIVHRRRVLLVSHKRYNEWLPIGGHIELDEDPEQALMREIKEECGLKVKLLAERPDIAHRHVKPIPTPSYVDVHRISPPPVRYGPSDRPRSGRTGGGVSATHKHIAFVYFAGAKSDRVKLHTREHSEFGWFSKAELDSPRLKLTRSIKFYCRQALREAAHA